MLKKVFVIALVLVFTFTLPFSTYAESLEQGLADVEDAIGGKLIARPAALIIR